MREEIQKQALDLAINNKLFTEVEKVGGQISSILYSPSLYLETHLMV